ncbi:MAG: hypothetical protein IKF42_10020 [Mogibacterium sp.]|nr:hypothetical protein [Mogibacterium sp.]
MAENDQIINGVDVTSTDVKCPGCGATIGIKFDPATFSLYCPFCGLSSQLLLPHVGEVATELDFNSAVHRSTVNWGRMKKLITCSNCAGQSLYDAEQVTGACPFCGSTSVTSASEDDDIMAPNAVIPFYITKEQTQECFINFLKRKRFIPKKVFKCKLENIVGIYLPFWTFDTLTISSFKALYLDYRNESDKYVTGVWNQYIDDAIVFASDKIRHPFLSKIQKYNFERAVPYSPEYLAGIPAERYTVGLNEGWERVKKTIPPKIRKNIDRQHKRLYVEKLDVNYYNVKFRCLLAPVYLASYRYGKKKLLVAINGQTGETYCDAPTYIKRIILSLILAFILLCAMEAFLIWFQNVYLP